LTAGCENGCSRHGQCTLENGEYRCDCIEGWAGSDCSTPLEMNCNDGIDNDKGKHYILHYILNFFNRQQQRCLYIPLFIIDIIVFHHLLLTQKMLWTLIDDSFSSLFLVIEWLEGKRTHLFMNGEAIKNSFLPKQIDIVCVGVRLRMIMSFFDA
jgi:hypothetical protein